MPRFVHVHYQLQAGILCRKQHSASRGICTRIFSVMTRALGKKCLLSSLTCPRKLLLCSSHHRFADRISFCWFLMLSIPCGYLHAQYMLNLTLLQRTKFCWYFSDRACGLKGAAACFQQDASALAIFGLFWIQLYVIGVIKLFWLMEQMEHI